MVDKKPTAKQASLELLDLNNQAHKALGDFVNLLTIKEDIALVPHAPLQAAWAAGNVASNLLQKVKPTAPELKNIQLYTDAIAEVLDFYPEKQGLLTMPAELASKPGKEIGELDMTSILDNLANQIHDAAMDIVGATGEVGGCSVETIMPDEAHAVSQYCAGVVSNISKAKVTKVAPKKVTVDSETKFIKHPQIIVHKLGLHHVEVSPSSEDGKATVAIDYHDSVGYPDSKTRLEGVRQRLVKEGFKCYPQSGNIIYCWNDIEKDKLTRLATFFSLLLNADVAHMGKDTVPVVADKAWDIAGNLIQEYGDEVYKSQQGQVNWGEAHNQWMNEKVIYEKKAIYEDLRELTILRDRHHELEAIYHVETGGGTMKGAKEIAANAEKALDIIHKNGWHSHGLGEQINHLEKKIGQGDISGLVHISDAVGHVMHIALATVLAKEGTYGGCSMTAGDIENINAGNLAYCEGVLKGTMCEPSKSGNMLTHKVTPHSYQTFILDEDPEGGYHVTLFLPTKNIGGEMTKELTAFLKKHHKFNCTAEKCTAYIKTLDEIRQLALLISNLKGASKAIGEECIPKAITLANNTALGQNLNKEVFAFTQEPVMPNSKAWIDMCHKKYGILPPGLTEEEKTMLQLLGPEKVYGGCDFSKSDAIPNEGVLRYCEGVRTNPQSKINAHFNPQGKLDHYFHATTDRLAAVNITPIEENKYLVELGDIDMRGKDLQSETLDYLKKTGFTCPTNNQCSAELSPLPTRELAAFLSSLHQIYKLTPACTKASVQYVVEKLGTLPNDAFLFANEVYPWYQEEWNEEVCSKIKAGKKPEAIPAEVLPPKPAGVKEWVGGPTPQPPFKVGGCTSKTKVVPTKVKQAYCHGVLGAVKSSAVPQGVVFEMTGLLPGTAAQLGPTENWHDVGNGLKVLFDSKWSKIYITLPEQLAKIKPLIDTLTKKFYLKDQGGNTYAGWPSMPRLARFFSHLSMVHTLPDWCHEAAVLYAFNQAQNADIKMIYPYVKEDWEKEVCAAAAPPGVKVKIKPSADELQQAILNYLKPSSPAEWHSFNEIASWIKENFYVDDDTIYQTLQYLAQEGKVIINPAKGYMIAEEAIPEVKFHWHGPMESYHAKAGGGWQIPKAHIIELVKTGVPKDTIVSLLMAEKPWYGTGFVKITNEAVANEIADLYIGEAKPEKKAKPTFEDLILNPQLYTPDELYSAGTISEVIAPCFSKKIEEATGFHTPTGKLVLSTLWPEYSTTNHIYLSDEVVASLWNECVAEWQGVAPAKPSLDELIAKSYEKSSNALMAISKVDLEKAHETKEYKKLPKAVKNYLHAMMNWLLLHDYKGKVPYETTIKELQKNIIEELKFPITPLMVKLQLEIEKKAKIRKGELPPEAGEAVAQTYDELTENEKESVNEAIKEELEKVGPGQAGMVNTAKIAHEAGIKDEEHLWVAVGKISAEMWPEEEKKAEEEKPLVLDAFILNTLKGDPGTPFDAGGLHLLLIAAEGLDVPTDDIQAALEALTQKGEIKWVIHTNTYFWGELEGKPVVSAPLKKWNDLTTEKRKNIAMWVSEQIEQGKKPEEILETIVSVEGIDIDTMPALDILVGWYKQMVEEGEVTPEQVEQAKQVIVDYFMSNPGEKFAGADIEDYIVNQTDFGNIDVETLLNELTAEKKISYDSTTGSWYFTPEGADKELHLKLAELLKDYWSHNPDSIMDKEALKEALAGYGYMDVMDSQLEPALEGLESNNYIHQVEEGWAWAEKKIPFSEFTPEKQANISSFIHGKTIEGLAFYEIKEAVQSEYPELEWDAEMQNTLKEAIKEHQEWKLKSWDELTDAEKVAFAKAVAEADISGWHNLKTFAEEHNIIPEEDVLPSVLELKEMAAASTEALESLEAEEEKMAYLKEPWLAAGNTLEIKKLHKFGEETGVGKCFADKAKQAGSKYEFSGPYYPVYLKVAVNDLGLDQETIKKLWTTCYAEWGVKAGWIVEKPVMVPVMGVQKNKAFVEATKKTIIESYEAGLSVPNIVQNAYSPGWQDIPGKDFKAWVQEVIKEHKTKEPKTISEISEVQMDTIAHTIKDKVDAGWDAGEINALILKNYSDIVVGDNALFDYIQGMITMAAPQPPIQDVAKAIELINSGKPYCGCHPDFPGVALSPTQVVYCEGIMTPPDKKKAGYVAVTHNPETGETVPIVSQYGDGYNVLVTTPEGPNSLGVTFAEMDKGKEWKKRQQAVSQSLVEELKFECGLLNDHFTCARAPLDMNTPKDIDAVRTTAIFLSSLHDVDKLDRGCIDDAVRRALRDARSISKEDGALAYKVTPYPYTVEEWNEEVCSKLVEKPAEIKALDKAKELGTVKLLELANEHDIDPTGSDASLALKLIKAGIIDP